MLVTLQEIIGMAEKGNYCIPAFNVYNTETVMGVFDAAEEAKAPVIMQVYPRLFNEKVGYYLAPAILAALPNLSPDAEPIAIPEEDAMTVMIRVNAVTDAASGNFISPIAREIPTAMASILVATAAITIFLKPDRSTDSAPPRIPERIILTPKYESMANAM